MTVVGILHEDVLYFSCHLECDLLKFIMVKDIGNRFFTKKNATFYAQCTFFIPIMVFKKNKIKINKGE